jgi:two-component system, OmpR family, phosphate regulon sensor histidine kinase PhoR
MLQNLTIRQLIVIVTLIITLGNAIVLSLFFYLSSNFDSTLIFWISIVATFIISFLIVSYFINRFLLARLKVIYKMLRSTKIGDVAKETDEISKLTMAKVNDDVIELAQARNQEIENLRSLESYRKDFVGNISHELKTPIFSIQGYLHTLLEGGIYNSDINKNYLQRAMRNVDRLQNIVEDLEVINKLESGDRVITKENWEIKALVNEVIHEIHVLATAKSMNIIYNAEADRNYSVIANREMIRQVLTNLLTNAVKYGRDHTNIEVAFYDIDQNILVEISDSGIGIETHHIKHLFDRFYRVDSARTRQIGGSGLGLSIVKHIVEAHEQQLNVRSTPGIGSTFGFTLAKS